MKEISSNFLETTITNIDALVFEELMICMSRQSTSSDVRSSIYQLVRSIIKQSNLASFLQLMNIRDRFKKLSEYADV